MWLFCRQVGGDTTLPCCLLTHTAAAATAAIGGGGAAATALKPPLLLHPLVLVPTPTPDLPCSFVSCSLRGSNLSDADFAASGVQMRLVTMDASGAEEGEALPLEYDPGLIEEVRGRTPVWERSV